MEQRFQTGTDAIDPLGGTPADRLEWAVDIMSIQHDDKILEIGCGRGKAVQMNCERLTGGRITAIDRSTQMTEAACALNADHIRSGKAAIRTFGLLSCDLPSDAFDKVFLFNLNVFWMDPVEELAEIRRILRSDGIFYLFHQPPPGSDISEYSAKFRENLTLHRFAIIDEIIGSFEPVGAVCLISRPA